MLYLLSPSASSVVSLFQDGAVIHLALRGTWSHPWFFYFVYQAPTPVASTSLTALESILFLQLPALVQAFVCYLVIVTAS